MLYGDVQRHQDPTDTSTYIRLSSGMRLWDASWSLAD
jgi:hypothetical protein